MAIKLATIVIVGCGPGSVDYITPAACKVVENADVLAGAQRLLDLFPKSDAMKIAMKSDVESLLDELEIQYQKGKKICVIVTGDPGLCSLAAPVRRRFGQKQCRNIAGVSSVQAAFAAIGLDWMNAWIIDAHGGLPKIEHQKIRGNDKIAILLGSEKSFEWAADFIVKYRKDLRLYLCSNLTLENEAVIELSSAQLSAANVPSKSILLIIKEELLQ